MEDLDIMQRDAAIENNSEDTGKDKRIETWEDMLGRLAALRLQERYESREQCLDRLFRYKGSAMSDGSALLCPGDYMMLTGDDHFLRSTRGVEISVQAGDLERMIESGAMDNALSMSELNGPDRFPKLDAIMNDISAQADYKDAARYCAEHGGHKAAALYGTAAVIREGRDFSATVDPARIADAEAIGRECSYEEFNPYNREILRELDKDNPERSNGNEAFEKLKAEMGRMGADPKAANKAATPYDKLQAQLEGIADGTEENGDITPFDTSKAMRRAQ